MKVTYVDHTAQLGGGELAMARLLDALAEHAPWVEPAVVLFEDGPLAARIRERGVPVEVVPLGPSNELRRDEVVKPWTAARAVSGSSVHLGRLVRAVRRQRPEIVHTNSMKAHVIGGLAARVLGRPLVWHLRDRLADDYLPSLAVRGMRGLSRVLPAMVVANSNATAATLPTAVRRVVIPSPVSHPRPSPEPNGPFTVGCIGRLAPWKGQHVLLDAFACAFPTGPARLRLVGGALFGETAYEASLRSQVRDLGLAGRVDFTGHVDDVAAELDRMHVVVHCSTVPEPFGQVVVEAMAAGRAVVAADAGGPAEIVRNDRTGLLTPPGDVARLADALRRLHAEPAERLRLGAAASQDVAPYGPAVVAAAVAGVYRALA